MVGFDARLWPILHQPERDQEVAEMAMYSEGSLCSYKSAVMDFAFATHLHHPSRQLPKIPLRDFTALEDDVGYDGYCFGS